jgi:hypothetical protein
MGKKVHNNAAKLYKIPKRYSGINAEQGHLVSVQMRRTIIFENIIHNAKKV